MNEEYEWWQVMGCFLALTFLFWAGLIIVGGGVAYLVLSNT